MTERVRSSGQKPIPSSVALGETQATPSGRERRLGDTKSTKARDSFQGSREPGRTFSGPPRGSDVRQGRASDCYFLSSLAALAERNPQIIQDMIRENPDGTVTVTFHHPNAKPRKSGQEEITVTRDIPPDGVQAERRAQWPALIEKAWAQARGGYDKIGKGGDPSTAVFALTGRRPRREETRGRSTESLMNELDDSLRKGDLITATTPPSVRAVDGAILKGNHVYSVEGMVQENGESFVMLRDPQDPKETFLVSARQFQQGVGTVNITGVPNGKPNTERSFEAVGDVRIARGELGTTSDLKDRYHSMSDGRLKFIERNAQRALENAERTGNRDQALEAREILATVGDERELRQQLAEGPRPSYALRWHRSTDEELNLETDRVEAEFQAAPEGPEKEELRVQVRILYKEQKRRSGGGGPREQTIQTGGGPED